MSNADVFGEDDFMKGRFAADAGVHARFYTLMVHDEEASAKAGRPIFDGKEFVEIIAAGNANNIVKRKATSEDKQRFRRQYEIFCRDKEAEGEQLIGTPLTEIPWLTHSQKAEFAYLHIHTLEQLANVDDNTCSRLAGMYDMRRKAKESIAAADKAAPMAEVMLQMEQMKVQLAELLEQNKLLKESQKAVK